MSSNHREIDDGKSPGQYTDPDFREANEGIMEDTVDSIVHLMPMVLPAAGAVLIFLLAFIAVYMA
jgi:hypothetical protein